MQPNQVCSSNQIIWLESVDQAASFRWLSLIRANWRSLALSSLSHSLSKTGSCQFKIKYVELA